MNFLNPKMLVGLTGACVTELLCNLLGGWDMWLKALVIFVILDYISGVLSAFINRKLDSDIGFRGISKKILIFIMVAVSYQIDILLNINIIKQAVIGFYLATEGLSIMENVGRAGMPLPEIVAEALEKLQKLEEKE